jgi:hypothetical protein
MTKSDAVDLAIDELTNSASEWLVTAQDPRCTKENRETYLDRSKQCLEAAKVLKLL